VADESAELRVDSRVAFVGSVVVKGFAHRVTLSAGLDHQIAPLLAPAPPPNARTEDSSIRQLDDVS